MRKAISVAIGTALLVPVLAVPAVAGPAKTGRTPVVWSMINPGGVSVSHRAPATTFEAVDIDGAPVSFGVVAAEAGTPCWTASARNATIYGELKLPVGATITGFTAYWFDESPGDLLVFLWKKGSEDIVWQGVGGAWSTGDGGYGSSSPAVPLAETVDPREDFKVSVILPTALEDSTAAGLCGIEMIFE
jgi:hypothetical protein